MADERANPEPTATSAAVIRERLETTWTNGLDRIDQFSPEIAARARAAMAAEARGTVDTLRDLEQGSE